MFHGHFIFIMQYYFFFIICFFFFSEFAGLIPEEKPIETMEVKRNFS